MLVVASASVRSWRAATSAIRSFQTRNTPDIEIPVSSRERWLLASERVHRNYYQSARTAMPGPMAHEGPSRVRPTVGPHRFGRGVHHPCGRRIETGTPPMAQSSALTS